jgi:small subunit ribosomal protein S17
MTNEEVAPETTHETQAVTGEPADDTQAATASAPDRSTGDTNGELQRAGGGAATSTERPRAARKVREGVVVSNGMDKTAVVAVIERVRHPKYNKFVLQTKKLYAHDEANDVNVGDRVRVMEMRPVSKTKRWRVTDVLERAK